MDFRIPMHAEHEAPGPNGSGWKPPGLPIGEGNHIGHERVVI